MSTVLICPACKTRYETEAIIPPEGRKVRCAKCGDIWHAGPEPEDDPLFEAAAAEAAASEDAAVATAEAGADAEPEAETGTEAEEPASGIKAQPLPDVDPDPDIDFQGEDALQEDSGADALASDANEPDAKAPALDTKTETPPVEDASFDVDDEEDTETESDDGKPDAARADDGTAQDTDETGADKTVERGRGRAPGIGAGLGWAALALCVIALGAFAVIERTTVVSVLPGTARYYAAVGMAVNLRGLEFNGVKYSWDTDAGRPVLEVDGDIVNVAGKTLDVPEVVFALSNTEGVQVYQWTTKVREEPLGPGSRARFQVRIPTPPKSIHSLQVRFAKSQ